MYQHLSVAAEEVLQIAYEIAQEDNGEYLGTEHILLAILKHKKGLGAGILEEYSITPEALRQELSRQTRDHLDGDWVFGRLPGTPHFKQVMAYAIEESERLGNAKICTEHILLGLLREKGCVAEKTLGKLGVDLDPVRQKVISQKTNKNPNPH